VSDTGHCVLGLRLQCGGTIQKIEVKILCEFSLADTEISGGRMESGRGSAGPETEPWCRVSGNLEFVWSSWKFCIKCG